jgi:hypothetical protein
MCRFDMSYGCLQISTSIMVFVAIAAVILILDSINQS